MRIQKAKRWLDNNKNSSPNIHFWTCCWGFITYDVVTLETRDANVANMDYLCVLAVSLQSA